MRRGTEAAATVVGTDIVRIARIEESLSRFGERFIQRVYTAREAAYCDKRTGQLRTAAYAARFAGKESVIKALGSTDVAFTEVEIVCDAAHRPSVELHGRARANAAAQGLTGFAVSLSHEDDYVVATAIGQLYADVGPVTTHAATVITPDCRVALLDAAEATFPRIREIYRIETLQGRVRNLTRLSAHSAAIWRLTTHALQVYGMLRRLDRRTVDLLCLYTSLLNGCRYCIDDAAGEALASGWRSAELLALGEPHETTFPPATAAALRYTATITRDACMTTDALIEDLKRWYDDEALIEITAVVSMKNFWNRFATALAIPPEGKCTDTELMAGLLTLSRSLRNPKEPRHAR